MDYLFFVFYFLLFGWLLTRSAFTLKSGIGKRTLIALFSIKLSCGVLYGYLYSQPAYIQSSDTWQIYFESVPESRMLLHDPVKFFTGLFANPDHLSYSGFAMSSTSYWNNFKDNLLIKAEAVMNLLSGGRYYTNVVIYSFITFFGSIAFYRTLDQIYPGRKMLKIVSAFLVPSFLFWTSGLYKDGFLFLLMSIIVFHVNRWITAKEGGVKVVVIATVCLAGVFLLRNYVAFMLIPALAGWIISAVYKKGIGVFVTIYVLMALLVISSKYISPALDVPGTIASWQNGFLRLPARSAIPARRLDPSARGLMQNAPQAVNLGFLRPYLWENKGLQYVPYAIEVICSISLLAIFCIYRPAVTRQQRVFLYFCFFLVGSAWLLLGYTVNIIGALLRYKSIFYPFLIAPLLCSIDWLRIKRIINNNN